MKWKWSWKKKAANIIWRHEADQLRSLMEAEPDEDRRKRLECLLYLRLGYKVKQAADMAKVVEERVGKYIKDYQREGFKSRPKPKPVVVTRKSIFRFPVFAARDGMNFLFKLEARPTKEYRVLFLAYLKTTLDPRPAEIALAEIMSETKSKREEVIDVLNRWSHENSRSIPAVAERDVGQGAGRSRK